MWWRVFFFFFHRPLFIMEHSIRNCSQLETRENNSTLLILIFYSISNWKGNFELKFKKRGIFVRRGHWWGERERKSKSGKFLQFLRDIVSLLLWWNKCSTYVLFSYSCRILMFVSSISSSWCAWSSIIFASSVQVKFILIEPEKDDDSISGRKSRM